MPQSKEDIRRVGDAVCVFVTVRIVEGVHTAEAEAIEQAWFLIAVAFVAFTLQNSRTLAWPNLSENDKLYEFFSADLVSRSVGMMETN